MKTSRLKKAQRILNFYSNNFGFHEPFQILVDGTFCFAALQNKVAIDEQLQKYFQSQIRLLTTQCIILESETLGAKLTGSTLIVKKYFVHKCGHEGKPITGASCIKSMVKDSRYIVASQDRNLQEVLRRTPGVALLYLHKCTPVLEPPSDKIKDLVKKKIGETFETNIKQLSKLKELNGMQNNEQEKHVRKKKLKNPNPLSCKKKKSPKNIESISKILPDKTSKRKRIKIPNHVKSELLNNLRKLQ